MGTLEYLPCKPFTILNDDHAKSASSVYQPLEWAVASLYPFSLLLKAAVTK